MRRYDYALFDLDGTLTNPEEGILGGVRHALRLQGVPEEDWGDLTRLIGPPLVESFTDFFGFTPARAEEATRQFRTYYSQYGIAGNLPYEGIHEALAALQGAGIKLLLATSKPEAFAEQILGRFDLARYFHFVGGATMDNSRSKKADVVSYVLREGGVTDPTRAVMIGDRKFDIEGGHAHGLKAVGVLYGYGDRAELEAAGADALAATPAELCPLLLGEEA